MKNIFGYTTIAYFISRAFFAGITSLSLISQTNQDAWIILFFAIMIGLIPVYIFHKIASYDEELNIVQKIDKLFPNSGKYIKILLGIGVFAIVILNFWNLINLITTQFLNKTPNYVIGISLIIPIILLINKDNKIIARVSTILFFFSIILVITSIIGLLPKIQIDNLKPFMENNFLKGIIPYISYNTLPLFIILIFPNRYIKRSIIHGYIISSISLFIGLLFLISILGVNLVILFQYPEFHLLKLAFDGFITFRLENILAIQWIFDIFIFTSIGIKFCNETFNIKKNYIIPIIILILTNYIFPNNTIANTIITYYIPYIIPFIFLLIPVVVLYKQKKGNIIS